MIISKLRGGFGNQMFQYAFGKFLAVKHNTDLYLDLTYLNDRSPKPFFTYRDYELDVFQHSAKIASSEELKITKDEKNILKEKSFHFNQIYLNTKDNTYLHGYWQSEKYFCSIRDIIYNDFKFKNNFPEHLQEIKNHLNHVNSVCVHVRYNYLKNLKDKFTHGFVGLEYIEKAINLLTEQITDAEVFIFSDNIDWCKDNIKSVNKIHYLEKDFPNEDNRTYFRLMTQCKHFIISNSSFSWWVAWLSKNPKKIVIAPKKWFRFSLNNTKDLIPKGWIRL